MLKRIGRCTRFMPAAKVTMQTMQELQETTAEFTGHNRRKAVEEELRRVLQSASFRSSPRCRQFLKFVVTSTLEGHHELLKERTIGVEIFGRDPAYVTEGDSIVRVRASDVRRRLSQHYAADTCECSCRIEIPSGSYVPQFHIVASSTPEIPLAPAEPGPAEPAIRARSLPRPIWIAIAYGLLAALLFLLIKPSTLKDSADIAGDHNEQQLKDFWLPAIRDAKPVLLCIGSPTTYTFNDEYQEHLARTGRLHPAEQAGPRGIEIAGPGTSIPAADILLVRSEYVGAGDANLAVLLSALFSHYGKATQFELSESTSYGQISDAPTVLVGAFSNQWTLSSAAKLPFTFAETNHVRMVQENDGQRRRWVATQLRVDGKTSEDYAIVTRLSNSDTGKFLVMAAGISGFGSRAAGYFLTRPDLLARALKDAPRDWSQKNAQFVLETKVVDNAPTAPTVVARRIW